MEVEAPTVAIHFSDFFEVDPVLISDYGAFNISLLRDLPLFVDPFLLFNSDREDYEELHEQMIRYLRFLKEKAIAGGLVDGLESAWFRFPEVRQNWLGYSKTGNRGHGLGAGFAEKLRRNLASVFANFGDEQITRGSHLEKLTLIDSGIGRDSISDFTTNLIKGFLVEYTETFARLHIDDRFVASVSVGRSWFNYETETWAPRSAVLPQHQGDFVLLTPRDILTRHEAWISRRGFDEELGAVIESVPNVELRAQLNNYFMKVLPEEPTKSDRTAAITSLIREYPVVVEHFVKLREDTGNEAIEQASSLVNETELTFVNGVNGLSALLATSAAFGGGRAASFDEARERALYLKDVVENKGGHRFFYHAGKRLVRREEDLQLMYQLAWYGTNLDVSREVNDGRGPADFKISHGAFDKTIVEFKLASNTSLKRNLENQVAIYQAASDAKSAIKVIVFFSEEEHEKVKRILKDLALADDPNVVLIDARADNKPSASKA